MNSRFFLSILCFLGSFSSRALIAEPARNVQALVTNADRSSQLQFIEDAGTFSYQKHRRTDPIVVDERQCFQSIAGFGFALTGGSAELLEKMTPEARNALLRELFLPQNQGIGISYLRLTLGASDLNRFVFSYDDLPEGQSDPELLHFDLAQDRLDVIPVMQEILKLNPDIEILASPWSAPIWMKDNLLVRGGHLKPECYHSYAVYLAKYIQSMDAEGINIRKLTIQNEPLNCRNTPSMQWYLEEQRDFLKNHLKPVFESTGVETEVLLFDHNLDRPDYPLSLLSDPEISQFAAGSAFHHYGGSMSAMSKVHMARPDKDVYFTEQMITENPASTTLEIAEKVQRMIINTMRNWSRNVVLWNLAADPNNDPHTDNGGCSMCQGALTLDGDDVTRNVAYYTIAQVSKWVSPGSVRIASTNLGDPSIELTEDEENDRVFRAAMIPESDVPPNVAFLTPEGNVVLVVANTSFHRKSFEIQYHGQFLQVELPPGAVGTYRWNR